MAVLCSPFGPKPQFELSSGVPAVGNKLFFYVAGSVNTKQNTYTSSTGAVPNTNPIILDALGQPTSVEIWFTAGQTYKVVYAPSTDTDPPTSPIWTIDNLSGINDVSASFDQWIPGPAPTFVSTTSFTLVGDQTGNFQPSRRVKTTNSGGTIYSAILTSTFGVVTTVVVANDSGVLDSGLSAVSYSLISATNQSINADMVNRKGTAVASAATTNIWGIAGDFVHITGSTGPITSFGTAPYAGAQRTVIFDSAPTITHNATTLQLPGAANIFAAAGDRAIVRADTTANMVVVEYTRTSGLPAVGTSVLRSYLSGLALSTAGGSATMSIAAGQATDSTTVAMMTLSAIGKTTSAWAVGTGNGGLDTGAIATSTWYHFWLITRIDTGVVDVLMSLSATSPTMPANYTLKRRIGSGKTDGASQWTAFIQDGDFFQWLAMVGDFQDTNPGTSAVTKTLTVPTGINVLWYGSILVGEGTTGGVINCLVSDPAVNDVAPSTTSFTLRSVTSSGGNAANPASLLTVRTNTTAQIRYRLDGSDAATTINAATRGWFDRRGRDA